MFHKAIQKTKVARFLRTTVYHSTTTTTTTTKRQQEALEERKPPLKLSTFKPGFSPKRHRNYHQNIISFSWATFHRFKEIISVRTFLFRNFMDNETHRQM